MVPIYSHICSSQKLFYLQNPELCSTLAFRCDALTFRSYMFLSFSEICQLWADHYSTGPLFLILLYSCFLLSMQFFSLWGLGAVGRISILLKFCHFFFIWVFTEVYCQGEALSKGNIYLRFLRTWTPKNFLFLWLLSNFPLRLVISPLIALTDNLEYVGSLSLVSLFTLKTCCQLFPFRMESSPGEWLVAFRSRFGTTSQHSLFFAKPTSPLWLPHQVCEFCVILTNNSDV